MELQRLLPLLHDDFSNLVRWMDRATLGLHEGWGKGEQMIKGCLFVWWKSCGYYVTSSNLVCKVVAFWMRKARWLFRKLFFILNVLLVWRNIWTLHGNSIWMILSRKLIFCLPFFPARIAKFMFRNISSGISDGKLYGSEFVLGFVAQ